MTFDAILDQAIAILQRRGRVTYRMLKRQFHLDDAALADLTVELIKGQQLATDEDGEVLVWTGDTRAASAPALALLTSGLVSPATGPERAPVSYTPPHLAEKILTSRSALEGERKQVMVLFCDLVNSIPIAARIGAEHMHTLLHRFFALVLEEVHQYEGTINQFLGDGFMALFGAPITHVPMPSVAAGVMRKPRSSCSSTQARSFTTRVQWSGS